MKLNNRTPSVKGRVLLIGLCVSFGIIIFSFFLGRYPGPYLTSPVSVLKDTLARTVVMEIRTPRIIMAFLLGMVLSASGMTFQMIFRNPLVDSGFLGVSGGAAFGASLAN